MADYSATVNLPKTDFPMKAELPKREPEILELWDKLGLYHKMLEAAADKPVFSLHDGPPYANGHIHIGHALNKTLKDMAVKSHALDGKRAPYVPGWDCHGLPIEQALLKEMAVSRNAALADVPAFRKKAAAFAQRWIDVQRADFKRLGVTGDWDHPYTTMSPEYESAILRAFRVLLNAGFIYRGLKPVYWCWHDETALAEAEVEYKDRTSPSVYVAFKVRESPFKLKPGEDCSALIWTTTPWTLPANVALAFHPDFEYVRVRLGSAPRELVEEAAEPQPRSVRGAGGTALKTRPKVKKKAVSAFKSLILAKVRLAAVMEELGIREYEVLDTKPGREFEHMKADHPLGIRESVGVLADYVTGEDGTGIVHTAPGHGREDFETGRRYKLPTPSPVDGAGRFTREAGAFAGLRVDEANEKIIESLQTREKLLGRGEIKHSYPHCWRCKNPIIFRATEQWFLSVEHQGLRAKLLTEAEKVTWMPEVGLSRISGMLKLRPDWCLSRQRVWGTPIPIVYCAACGKPVTSNEALLAIERRVAREGTDFWFAEEADKLVPPGTTCKNCGGSKFRKETDILDVWMDSGCSWLAVLKADGLYPADLYLEGSDQHRGWFQSSLVLSAAMEGRPPFKGVLTHGFVLDEQGRAMHKSLGNVVSPQAVIEKSGADVLRLWVALSDVENDVRLSQKLLEGPIDMYRKIRNTLRFLLGNTYDFDPVKHAVPREKMNEADRFMLHCLAFLIHEVREDYRHFRFRSAIRSISDFCINELSAFYLDVSKDRLYIPKPDDAGRRSAQTVMHLTLTALVRLMAPVLSFTAEETWQNLRKSLKERGSDAALEESVFLSQFPEAREDWFESELELRWRRILSVRDRFNLEFEQAKKAGAVKSKSEAAVTLVSEDADTSKFLHSAERVWPEVLLVSRVAVGNGAVAGKSAAEFVDAPMPHRVEEAVKVVISKAPGEKCARCWQVKTDVAKDTQLCARCFAALA